MSPNRAAPRRSRTVRPAKRRARPHAARSRRTRAASASGSSPALAYNVTVADVMTREPVSVGPTATLYDAAVLMRSNRVAGLPVVDARGDLNGVVSERDIARVFEFPGSRAGTEGMLDALLVEPDLEPAPDFGGLRRRIRETKVSEAMSRPPFTIHSDAPLELAMEVMTENQIHRLPVVQKNHLVGIVTTHDLLRAVWPSASRH